MILRTLAPAYAETGRYGDAAARARRAPDLAAGQKKGSASRDVAKGNQANVYENPVVEKGLSAQTAGWAFTQTQVFNWLPPTTLFDMRVMTPNFTAGSP